MVLGPLTLMPILFGADVQWMLAAALEAYPSLVGHLAYGGTMTLVSHHLIRRYTVPRRPAPWPQVASKRRLTVEIPVPALWAFVLVMGVALPLLLAG